jgi:hypothetical protein
MDAAPGGRTTAPGRRSRKGVCEPVTPDDINAALALAADAQARADAATPGPWVAVAHHDQDCFSVVVRGTVRYVAGVMVSEPTADFIAAVRQDVPALADAVRRLADEVRTLRAILSDATSESSMYAQGVRDALAAVETVDASADGGSSTRQGVFLARDAVRALLTVREPCTGA